MKRVWTFGVVAAGLLAGVALADPPADQKPAAPPPDPLAGHCRAGWPLCVAPWAIPSSTPAYCGGYVGGGCAHCPKCEDRSPEEGTWGWDYVGWVFHRRVFLGWWHGRREQAGIGAYKTDGPKLKPHEQEEHH
jgi:hypothetical protein